MYFFVIKKRDYGPPGGHQRVSFPVRKRFDRCSEGLNSFMYEPLWPLVRFAIGIWLRLENHTFGLEARSLRGRRSLSQRKGWHNRPKMSAQQTSSGI